MNAWSAASATWRGTAAAARCDRGLLGRAGGDRVGERSRAPELGGASSARELASRSATGRWRRAPRCRSRSRPGGRCELMPDAIPARAGGTTPSAVEAIAGLASPIPAPASRNPGQQPRPAVAELDAVHQQPARPRRRSARRPAALGPGRSSGASRDRRDDEREQRDRQEAQARLERRVAEHVLHVEREVEEHREHPGREREGDDRDAAERGHPEQRRGRASRSRCAARSRRRRRAGRRRRSARRGSGRSPNPRRCRG